MYENNNECIIYRTTILSLNGHACEYVLPVMQVKIFFNNKYEAFIIIK